MSSTQVETPSRMRSSRAEAPRPCMWIRAPRICSGALIGNVDDTAVAVCPAGKTKLIGCALVIRPTFATVVASSSCTAERSNAGSLPWL
jgi:hypothetical protein